jgi:hypothetical protein
MQKPCIVRDASNTNIEPQPKQSNKHLKNGTRRISTQYPPMVVLAAKPTGRVPNRARNLTDDEQRGAILQLSKVHTVLQLYTKDATI